MSLLRCIVPCAVAAALAAPATAAASPWDAPDGCIVARAGDLAFPPAPSGTTAVADRSRPGMAVDGFGAPAGAAQLEGTRGGDGGIASDTRLDGTVSGNSATQVVTGSNIIQSGSFANASGVPVVIQNSGANVLIQNATVINLQLK